jgi:hypothetical protein
MAEKSVDRVIESRVGDDALDEHALEVLGRLHVCLDNVTTEPPRPLTMRRRLQST